MAAPTVPQSTAASAAPPDLSWLDQGSTVVNPAPAAQASAAVPAGSDLSWLDQGSTVVNPSGNSNGQPSSVLGTVNRYAGLANRALLGGAAALPSELAGLVQGAGAEVADKFGYHQTAPPSSNGAPYSPQLSDFVHPDKWQQAAEYFADHTLGTPQPQTPTERVFSRAVQAVPSAVLAPEAPVAGALSAAGSAGASQIAAENGAGPLGQTIAGLAGGFGPGLAAGGTAAALRGLARGGEAGRTAVQQAIDDFAQSGGITPTVGQATGSHALLGIERNVSRIPGGGGPFAALAARQAAGLQGTVDDITSNLAGGTPITPTTAGSAVQAGIESNVKQLKANAAAAYDHVDSLVPPETPVPVTNTLQALQRIVTPTPGAEASTAGLVPPKLKTMYDNLQTDLQQNGGNVVPYGALKALKSAVGEQTTFGPFPTDPANGAMKQVYGAIRQDLNTGAASVSPEAQQALTDANSMYAQNQQKLDVLDGVVSRNGGPETVFNVALSGTKQGASTVNQVLSALNQDQRNLFAAALLKRMATASPGMQTSAAGDTFNVDQFLTNWSKISPDARQAIFGNLPDDYSQNLNTLARNIAALKASNRVLANPSGSAGGIAHSIWWMDLIGSVPMLFVSPHVAVGEAATALGTASAANIAARVLTSPKAVDWLARKTTLALTKYGAAPAAAAISATTQPGQQ
jgi:hypothetical protein